MARGAGSRRDRGSRSAPGRPPRAQPDDAAIRAAAGYRWVRDGAFTVAISPHAPPVSTYATDARTVVGADPDYAQLVADALGRTLVLLPIAWPTGRSG